MDLDQFLLFEVQGLVSTINEYTRNHYIRNYTSLLIDFSEDKEIEKLSLVINRLLEWYSNEILDMRTNKFLYNLSAHEKSIDVLKEIKKLLNKKLT